MSGPELSNERDSITLFWIAVGVGVIFLATVMWGACCG